MILEYNFFLFILLNIIVSLPIPFIKLKLLKYYSIIEIYLYSNIILQILFVISYFYYEKKNMKQLLNINKILDFNLIKFSLLVFITLLLTGIILYNERKILKINTYKRSLSLLFLTFYSICIYNEKYTMKNLFGLLIIIFGIYYVAN